MASSGSSGGGARLGKKVAWKVVKYGFKAAVLVIRVAAATEGDC